MPNGGEMIQQLCALHECVVDVINLLITFSQLLLVPGKFLQARLYYMQCKPGTFGEILLEVFYCIPKRF